MCIHICNTDRADELFKKHAGRVEFLSCCVSDSVLELLLLYHTGGACGCGFVDVFVYNTSGAQESPEKGYFLSPPFKPDRLPIVGLHGTLIHPRFTVSYPASLVVFTGPPRDMFLKGEHVSYVCSAPLRTLPRTRKSRPCKLI